MLTICIKRIDSISSPLMPFMNYTHSTELQLGLADLWWSIDTIRQEITFELHVRTTGWIGFGISPGLIYFF